MGLLIDGKWHEKDLPRANDKGEFVRPQSPYRAFISSSGISSSGISPSGISSSGIGVTGSTDSADGRFPAEAGRYHLFVNAGCPWAYRTILYRSIKSLSSLISLSLTQPAAGKEGWTFGDEPEPLLGARHIHDVYTQADPGFTGRATVPVLWDTKTHTIVNNESADIIRMFNATFNHIDGVNPVDYYPEALAEEIDQLNDRIYSDINNGVYRCGFAQSQSAYDAAFDRLFTALDDLDQMLATRRYLLGPSITEADWRLFATLIRFDLAYYGQFRCNRNRLIDFEYLWPYTRDLYQQPGVAETVDPAAIKGIYYGGRPPHILPRGPRIDFAVPHGRADS